MNTACINTAQKYTRSSYYCGEAWALNGRVCVKPTDGSFSEPVVDMTAGAIVSRGETSADV